MVFWARKKRKEFRPPPPPPASLAETVREATETAEEQYQAAHAREPEIDARRDRLMEIKKNNALGPRFFQALGEHRGS